MSLLKVSSWLGNFSSRQKSQPTDESLTCVGLALGVCSFFLSKVERMILQKIFLAWSKLFVPEESQIKKSLTDNEFLYSIYLFSSLFDCLYGCRFFKSSHSINSITCFLFFGPVMKTVQPIENERKGNTSNG
jgi:hypothetical protein